MSYRSILIVSAVLLGGGSVLAQPTLNQQLNPLPSRILGHPNPEQFTIESAAPNLVDGVEMWFPQGVALDTTASPPIVYVADTANNRVLAWKNSTGFSSGAQANLVIGQADMFSTFPGGPAANPPSPAGLSSPTGLVVDKNGALYVVDSGNNRILRFPAPFSQKQSPPIPDMVIGQQTLNTNTANYFASASAPITGQCIATAASGSTLTAGLAFDSSGNLWFTDAGNQRVLRYPAGHLPTPSVGNLTGGVLADIVIGQPSLTSNNPNPLNLSATNATQITNQFALPSAVGFNPVDGNLYVVDSVGDNTVSTSPTSFGRVLVFQSPNSLQSGNGAASRIMGVIPPQSITLTGQAATNFEYEVWFDAPNGVFFLPDGSVGVVDTGLNRLLIFQPYSQWPAQSTQYSPNATSVVGQGASNNFTNIYPNGVTTKSLAAVNAGATPPATASSLYSPSAAVLSPTNELFVADARNNRMVVMPVTGDSVGAATRVLGQANLIENSPNYIEGREFWFVGSGAAAAGMAIDTSGSVPHLYVADPLNNRVLGFYDARKVKADIQADLVIGQPNLYTALCNYSPSGQTSGDPTQPNQTSLCQPVGLAVDGSGNLYVADSLNGRVMRFPAPFANYPTVANLEPADMVIGQAGFGPGLRQATVNNMYSPFGLAITGKNGLLVSDIALNRVLYYPFDNNGTFNTSDSGNLSASKVFGQTSFTTSFTSNSLEGLNSPMGIATDAEGRLYVADQGNNRVVVFTDPNLPGTSSSGALATLSIPNLSGPTSVFVNKYSGGTDEIWIANTNADTCIRFMPLDDLLPGATAESNGTIQSVAAPLALLTDQNGALYVADATNRIAVYYPALQAVNGANFLADRPLAPGMFASVCSYNSNCNGGTPLFTSVSFTPTAQSFTQVPVSTVLGDVSVTVNGTYAPMFYVSPTQLNFYVPSNAPTSGFTNIEVTQNSTGQVLAAGLVLMNVTSPGIFMSQYTGSTRQGAILNEDNSINSPTNPAQRGHLIQIFATGQGVYSGWPADGTPAGTTNTLPAGLTQVLIGGCLLSEGTGTTCTPISPDPGTSGAARNTWIPFTGLAPGEVGIWQVNVQIPQETNPPTGGAVSAPATVELLVNGLASNDSPPPFTTVVYIK